MIDFIFFEFLDPENHVIDKKHLFIPHNSQYTDDRSFMQDDLDQTRSPRSRDGQTILIIFFLDSLTPKTLP